MIDWCGQRASQSTERSVDQRRCSGISVKQQMERNEHGFFVYALQFVFLRRITRSTSCRLPTYRIPRYACALNNASQTRHQKLVFLAASGSHDADLALIFATSSSLNCSSSAKTGNSLVRSPELVTYPRTIFFRYTPSAAFTPASRCFCRSPSILRLCNSACASSVRLRSSFSCACRSFN